MYIADAPAQVQTQPPPGRHYEIIGKPDAIVLTEAVYKGYKDVWRMQPNELLQKFSAAAIDCVVDSLSTNKTTITTVVIPSPNLSASSQYLFMVSLQQLNNFLVPIF
jgi:hypothetical protein